MKKFLKCFLVVFIFVTAQFPLNIIVGAEVNKDATTTIAGHIEKERQFPIPMLVKTEQISPNQIQISYDRDVDLKLGEKSTNYWIQDTVNVIPKGIATLGKNDKVNSSNSLTDNKVSIKAKNGSANTFILTFSQNITKGAAYKLIICYVTVEGAPPYTGDNGSANFVGR